MLVAGPLLVATTATLAIRSAHEGVVSGEGDFMIIQNRMATHELGVLIFLAFLLNIGSAQLQQTCHISMRAS